MTDQQFQGDEKRQHNRIVFRPKNRPRLTVNDDEFIVEDISCGGIKFNNENSIALPKEVAGAITFYDGETITVEGRIVWERDGYAGLEFKELIPESIVMKDQQHVNIDWGS